MKTYPFLTGVAACALAFSLTACDKAKDMTNGAADAVGKAADATKGAAGSAVDSVKDAAAGAMDTAKDAVMKAGGPVGEACAACKKMCEEKNYAGALEELKKVSGMDLSPEQKSVVDSLKAGVEKMMGEGAAKAGEAMDAAKAVMPK
jgi:hypothetical protein